MEVKDVMEGRFGVGVWDPWVGVLVSMLRSRLI